MKRDMDLIREILLKIEESPTFDKRVELDIDKYSKPEITYHVMLLYEAGLIDAIDESTFAGQGFIPLRLTWAGHEFVEASRDNDRWNKMKNIMAKTGGFVFELAKPLLIDIMRGQITQYNP